VGGCGSLSIMTKLDFWIFGFVTVDSQTGELNSQPCVVPLTFSFFIGLAFAIRLANREIQGLAMSFSALEASIHKKKLRLLFLWIDDLGFCCLELGTLSNQ
jgi:hypothetical protein